MFWMGLLQQQESRWVHSGPRDTAMNNLLLHSMFVIIEVHCNVQEGAHAVLWLDLQSEAVFITER